MHHVPRFLSFFFSSSSLPALLLEYYAESAERDDVKDPISREKRKDPFQTGF